MEYKQDMATLESTFPKLDKTAFALAPLFDESEDKAYWLSRTPHQRLQHIEVLRRINYGHQSTARLQRVLELASRTWR